MFSNKESKVWEHTLSHYESVLKTISATKKKSPAGLLESLDNWYQRELPEKICERKSPHLRHEELVKIVRWKLMRGKYRPRLESLADSNKNVESITQEAFSLLPNIKAASKKLCELKGIGPATASAILCAGSKGDVPFMADEAMEAIPGMGPIAYTDSYFGKYLEKTRAKARDLNTESKGNLHWTPHMVELALWTFGVARRLGIDLAKDDTLSSKRSGTDEEAEQTSAPTKLKRQRM